MKLIWEGEPPPDQNAVEAQILAELTRLALARPGDLLGHVIRLGPDTHSASVAVEGCGDAYHCTYCPATAWIAVGGRLVVADV